MKCTIIISLIIGKERISNSRSTITSKYRIKLMVITSIIKFTIIKNSSSTIIPYKIPVSRCRSSKAAIKKSGQRQYQEYFSRRRKHRNRRRYRTFSEPYQTTAKGRTWRKHSNKVCLMSGRNCNEQNSPEKFCRTGKKETH